MTYAIFTPVYGIPLNINHASSPRSEEMEDMIDGEVPGIITKYSGRGDYPVAFGIELGKGFDECAHHIEVTAVLLTATPEQVTEFDDLFAGLDDELKTEMLAFGAPRVFLLVSSS
jgi:hypothetical protein